MNFKKIIIYPVTAMIFAFMFQMQTAKAQPGTVGIGVQLGKPTGLSMKIYNPGTSLDILAAWDLDDEFFLNMHAIWDIPLGSDNFHFFYGPGAWIGLKDTGSDGNIANYGVSGNFGFDVFISNLELFANLTPRLSLENTDQFEIGGGAGIRFHF